LLQNDMIRFVFRIIQLLEIELQKLESM